MRRRPKTGSALAWRQVRGGKGSGRGVSPRRVDVKGWSAPAGVGAFTSTRDATSVGLELKHVVAQPTLADVQEPPHAKQCAPTGTTLHSADGRIDDIAARVAAGAAAPHKATQPSSMNSQRQRFMATLCALLVPSAMRPSRLR